MDCAPADEGADRGDSCCGDRLCGCDRPDAPGPMGGGTDPKFKYDAAKHEKHNELVCEPAACLAEILGTAILALVVVAVTDARNRGGPGIFAPVFIGLTVSILICVIAPLTQACFNPARDFGPRLFAYFAGWGPIAIPGPRGGFFTRDGKWAVENEGVGPDIDVENFPKDVIAGRDPQLERAVEVAMQLLKEKPVDRMTKEPPPPTWGLRKNGGKGQ